MGDHVHMLLMIPPKFSVANTAGFLKGKSGIRIFRLFAGEAEFHRQTFLGTGLLRKYRGLR